MKGKSTLKTYKINSNQKNYIEYLVHCPESKLIEPSILNCDEWPFDKNDDLNHWNDLLDRFEEIIQRIICTYTPSIYAQRQQQPPSTPPTHSVQQQQQQQNTSSPSVTITTASTTSSNPPQYIPILYKLPTISDEQYNHDKKLLLKILPFTKLLIAICSNGHIYHSSEELFQLLAFSDYDILIEVLKVLGVLLMKGKFVKDNNAIIQSLLIPKITMYSHGFPESHIDLLSLCKEHLEIPSPIFNFNVEFYEKVSNSKQPQQIVNNISPTTETVNISNPSTSSSSSSSSLNQPNVHTGNKISLVFSDLERNHESTFDTVSRMVGKKSVSDDDLFFVYYRVELAKSMLIPELRQKWVQLRLTSISVLYQPPLANDAQLWQNTSPQQLLMDEPDFLNELIELMGRGGNSGSNVESETIVAALMALSVLAFSFNTSSLNSALSRIFLPGSQGFFQSIVRKCIAVLINQQQPPQNELEASLQHQHQHHHHHQQPQQGYKFSPSLIKAVINFVFQMSNTNKSMIHASGIFQALLPIVRFHSGSIFDINLEINILKILQSMMFYKSANIELFGEQEVLKDFISSLSEEIAYIVSHPQELEQKEELVVENKRKNLISHTKLQAEKKLKRQLQSSTSSTSSLNNNNNNNNSNSSNNTNVNKSTSNIGPVSVVIKKPMNLNITINDDASKVDPRLFKSDYPPKVYKKKVTLVFEMLRCLIPIVSSNGVPRTVLNQLLDSNLLNSLKTIFANPQSFTPSTMTQAILFPTQLVQNEPTCFTALQSSGLIQSLFDYISCGGVDTKIQSGESSSSTGETSQSMEIDSNNNNNTSSSSSTTVGNLTDLPQEVIYTIPNTLISFCLNQSFKTMLVESKFIGRFISIFSHPKYASGSFSSRTCSAIAAGLDELIRQHPELRPAAIDATIILLDSLKTLDWKTAAYSHQQSNLNVFTMTIRFLANLFASGENDKQFIQQGGLDKVMELYNNPTIVKCLITTPTSQGFPITHYSKTIGIFKSLSINNTSAVLRALIKAMNDGFDTLDRLCQWRTSRLIRKYNPEEMQHADQINETVYVISAMVQVLTSLIKDHPEEIPPSVLEEWASDSGIKTSCSLSTLNRTLYWENISIKSSQCFAVPKKSGKESPKLSPTNNNSSEVVTNTDNDNSSNVTTSTTTTANTSGNNDEPKGEFMFQHLVGELEYLSHYFVDCLNPLNKRGTAIDSKSDLLVKTIAKNLSCWINWKPETEDLPDPSLYQTYYAEILREVSNLLYPQLIGALFEMDFYKSYFETLQELMKQLAPTDNDNSKPIESTVLEPYGEILTTTINSLTSKTQTAPVKAIAEKVLPVFMKEALALFNIEYLPRLTTFKRDLLDTISSMVVKSEEVPEPIPTVSKKKNAAPPPVFVPSEATILLLTDMGFIREHIERGMRTLSTNNAESVTDWMLNNPYVEEEPKPETKPVVAEPVIPSPPPEPLVEKITIEKMVNDLKPLLVHGMFRLITNTVDIPLLDTIMKLLVHLVKETKNQEMAQNTRNQVVEKLMNEVQSSLSDDISNSGYITSIFYLVEKLNDITEVHNLYLDKGFLSTLLSYLMDIVFNKASTMFNSDTEENKELNNRIGYLNSLLHIILDFIKPPLIKPLNYDYELEYKKLVDGKDQEPDGESSTLLDLCVDLLKITGQANPPNVNTNPAVAATPNKTSIADIDMSLLKVIQQLTLNHSLALQLLAGDGVQVIMSRTSPLNLSKEMTTLSIQIIKQIMGDRLTLQQTDQTIIKNTLANHKNNKGVSTKVFLTTLSRTLYRHPTIFIRACGETCRISQSNAIVFTKNPVTPVIGENERFPHIVELTSQLVKVLLTSGKMTSTGDTMEVDSKQSPTLSKKSTTSSYSNTQSTQTVSHSQKIFNKGTILRLLEEMSQLPMVQDILLEYKDKDGLDLLDYIIENFVTPQGNTQLQQQQQQLGGETGTSIHMAACRFLMTMLGKNTGRNRIISLVAQHLERANRDHRQHHDRSSQNKLIYLVNLIALVLNLPPHSCSNEISKSMVENDMINLLLQVMDGIDMSSSKASIIVVSMLQTIGHLTKYASNPPSSSTVDDGKVNIFEFPSTNFDTYFRNSRDSLHYPSVNSGPIFSGGERPMFNGRNAEQMVLFNEGADPFMNAPPALFGGGGGGFEHSLDMLVLEQNDLARFMSGMENPRLGGANVLPPGAVDPFVISIENVIVDSDEEADDSPLMTDGIVDAMDFDEDDYSSSDEELDDDDDDDDEDDDEDDDDQNSDMELDYDDEGEDNDLFDDLDDDDDDDEDLGEDDEGNDRLLNDIVMRAEQLFNNGLHHISPHQRAQIENLVNSNPILRQISNMSQMRMRGVDNPNLYLPPPPAVSNNRHLGRAPRQAVATVIRNEQEEINIYALSYESDLVKLLTKITKEEEAIQRAKDKEERKAKAEKEAKEKLEKQQLLQQQQQQAGVVEEASGSSSSQPSTTSPMLTDNTSPPQLPTSPIAVVSTGGTNSPQQPPLAPISTTTTSSSDSNSPQVTTTNSSSLSHSPPITSTSSSSSINASPSPNSPILSHPPINVDSIRNNPEINQINETISSPVLNQSNNGSNNNQMQIDTPATTTTTTTTTSPVSSTNVDTSASGSSQPVVDPSSSSSSSSSTNPTTTAAATTPASQPATITTDLGIDPTFLGELPPELRSEVLATQLNALHQENRGATIVINPDFLAALPADIQAEVLEQNRIIASRRAPPPPPISASLIAQDMDNASFLATLPPDLRDEVLLSQPEAFLSTLPPELHAEAVRLRERDRSYLRNVIPDPISMRGSMAGSGGLGNAAGSSSSSSRVAAKLKTTPNQTGELVKAENLLPLIKILYLDYQWNRQQLYLILQQICTFQESRNQLMNYLFKILMSSNRHFLLPHPSQRSSDMTWSPIEDPFHPTLKNKQFRVFEECLHPPLLVIRRILDIIHNLLGNNPFCIEWVCTEQSLPTTTSRKGKEKDDGYQKALPLWTLCSIVKNKEIFNKSSHLDKLISIILMIVENIQHISNLKKSKLQQQQSSPTSNSATTNSPTTTTTTTTDSSTNTTTTTAASPNPVDSLPSLPLTLPTFQQQYISNFIDVMLKSNGYSDGKVTTLLTQLAQDPDNRAIVLDELTLNAKQLVGHVIKNLNHIKSMFKESKVSPSTLVALYLPSTVKENNLLQILQTISHILTPKQPSANIIPSPPVNNQPVPVNNNNSSPALNTTTTPTISINDNSTTEQSTTNAKLTVADYFKHNNEFEVLWEVIKSLLSYMKSEKDEKPVTKQKLTKQKKSGTVPMSSLILPLMETYFLLNSPNPEKLNATTISSSPSLSGLRISNQHIPTTSIGGGGSSNNLSGLTTSLSSGSLSSLATSTPPLIAMDPQTIKFYEFVEHNKNLINDLIRQDNSLLTGSFAILIKIPKFLDFDNKRTYFRQYFQTRKERANTIRLKIRRNHIFEDSYTQLRMRPAEELKGKLHIQFSGEEGVDVGGLLREWYLVLSREMFNPNYALFKTSAADNVTFQPNPESYINPDHLTYFKFIGRIIGKSLYDGQMLDAFFTRSFYKHMLGMPITVTDMEAIDPQFHKNLIWILNNDITNVVDLTFSTEIDIFDSTRVIELKPGGANIPVTEDNKLEYVRLVASVRMTNSIKDQISHFLEGFHELIPKSLISIFNELELELLISGLPEIDIDDLKANSEYTGYTAESPQINWFWNVINNFSNEERALLLQFVTGTSKVPLDGFKSLVGMSGLQRFQIHRIRGNSHRLPTAHTCFNQIDLPEYESQEQLEKMLKIAISENSEGFGFV